MVFRALKFPQVQRDSIIWQYKWIYWGKQQGQQQQREPLKGASIYYVITLGGGGGSKHK